jgi:putative ABC transport system permease protein
MIRNHFIIAIRHLTRYRQYTIINLVGLSIGLACALMIILWIDHQVSMNKFHKNGKNIYQLVARLQFPDGQVAFDRAITSPLAPVLINEVPEIKDAIRTTWMQRHMFRQGGTSFFENGFYADSTFFRVFSFDLAYGDPATILNQPDAVAISEKMALKYFGTTSVMGRTLHIRTKKEELFTVTGVFKDVPVESSLQFDFVLPFSKYYQNNKEFIFWGNFDLMTFILTEPNVNMTILKDKMTGILHKYNEWSRNNKVTIFGQSLEDVYLYGEFREGSVTKPSGLITYIRILTLVVILVLILACMNYVNMATALATKRAREVGVRKTFGSGRSILLKQFISESVTLSLLSFIMACGLVWLLLPGFNQALSENISFTIVNPVIRWVLYAVPFLTGLIAGIFPAIYLSSYKPINALKILNRPGKGNIRLRYLLVVFQFIITIAFIISSIVVFRQAKFIRNKNLGLNKDNVIFFNQNENIPQHREAFKAELSNIPGVASVSYTFNNPLDVGSSLTCRSRKNPNEDIFVSYMVADHDFVKTLGIEEVMGRIPSTDPQSSPGYVLINQEMAKTLGIENPVGEILKFNELNLTVSGVIKDFHFNNLRVPIKQMIIFCGLDGTDKVMVKLKGDKIQETIKTIEKKFHDFETVPFEYSFLDEAYYNQYQTEQSMGKLINLFTVIAIIISCLGLFGLALFTAEQRTKEIGIRKINGANPGQIIWLLLNDFLKWLIISFVVAGIISCYILNIWLQSFAYRTSLDWWIFIFAGGIVVTIVLITVSWLSWNASCKNPVEALRYE